MGGGGRGAISWTCAHGANKGNSTSCEQPFLRRSKNQVNTLARRHSLEINAAMWLKAWRPPFHSSSSPLTTPHLLVPGDQRQEFRHDLRALVSINSYTLPGCVWRGGTTPTCGQTCMSDMLDGQLHGVDNIPAHARTAHRGLLQNRVE